MQAFSNSARLESVFGKLSFRDGLVRTMVEIKQRFQNSLA